MASFDDDQLMQFGRDDGIVCDTCGGPTYLTQDQGRGLCAYRCDTCDDDFLVQYDSVDDEADEVDDLTWLKVEELFGIDSDDEPMEWEYETD